MKLPDAVSKFGYTFKGWSTEKAGIDADKYRNQITKTDKQNFVFYAQWERNTYNIEYNLDFIRPTGDVAEFSIDCNGYTVTDINGNVKAMPDYPKTYTYGDSFNLPNKVTYPGYDGYVSSEIWFNKKTKEISVNNAQISTENGVISGYPDDMTRKTSVSPSTIGFANSDASTAFDYTDLHLYVKPIPNNYYLKFEKNTPKFNGNPIEDKYFTGNDMGNQLLVYDFASQINNCLFSYAGYTFVGWNTKPDGTGTAFSNKEEIINLTTTQNDVITLYAQWQKNTNTHVTIKYYQETFEDGVYPSNPYETINLYLTTDTEYSASNINGVNYVKDDKYAGFSLSKVTKQESNGSSTTITPNYIFRVLPDGSQVISVYYKRLSYNFTFKVNEPEMIKRATAMPTYYNSLISFSTNASPSSGTIVLKYNETITFNATYETKYRFKKYSGTDIGDFTGGASTTHQMPASNLTVTLYSELNQATVIFYANCGSNTPYSNWSSTVSDATKTKIYTYGLQYGSFPTPDIGRQCYEFLGWYTSRTGGTRITEKTVFDVNSSLTLYAHWHKYTSETNPGREHHSYVTERTKNPTCEGTGIDTHTCIYCGDSYTTPVSALGHNFAGACSQYSTASSGHWWKCTDCSAHGTGTRVNKNQVTNNYYSHSFEDETQDGVATCESGTTKSKKCSACSYKKQTGTVAALGHLKDNIGQCGTIHPHKYYNIAGHSCSNNWVTCMRHVYCGRNGTCNHDAKQKYCLYHGENRTGTNSCRKKCKYDGYGAKYTFSCHS